MPTVLKEPPPPAGRPGRVRITRELADWMRDSGEIVGRYELIDGEIVSKMGQNASHAYVVVCLVELLTRLFGARFIRIQLPIRVANADSTYNEPEPDAAVLARPAEAFLKENPGPPDVLVVFEVADTSVMTDVHVKSRLYARAAVPEYVVIDLVERRAVVHTEPGPAGYDRITVFAHDEAFSLSAAGAVGAAEPIPVAALLPPD